MNPEQLALLLAWSAAKHAGYTATANALAELYRATVNHNTK